MLKTIEEGGEGGGNIIFYFMEENIWWGIILAGGILFFMTLLSGAGGHLDLGINLKRPNCDLKLLTSHHSHSFIHQLIRTRPTKTPAKSYSIPIQHTYMHYILIRMNHKLSCMYVALTRVQFNLGLLSGFTKLQLRPYAKGEIFKDVGR